MPSEAIQRVTNQLPAALRDNVNGYVDAVEDAIPDIERQAGVRVGADRVDEFLLLVAVRRIWSAINTQYWTMNDCIEIAARSQAGRVGPETETVRGFRLGRDEISPNSAPVRESQTLRQEFDALLAQHDLRHLVSESTTLSELATEL